MNLDDVTDGEKINLGKLRKFLAMTFHFVDNPLANGKSYIKKGDITEILALTSGDKLDGLSYAILADNKIADSLKPYMIADSLHSTPGLGRLADIAMSAIIRYNDAIGNSGFGQYIKDVEDMGLIIKGKDGLEVLLNSDMITAKELYPVKNASGKIDWFCRNNGEGIDTYAYQVFENCSAEDVKVFSNPLTSRMIFFNAAGLTTGAKAAVETSFAGQGFDCYAQFDPSEEKTSAKHLLIALQTNKYDGVLCSAFFTGNPSDTSDRHDPATNMYFR